MKTNLTDYQNLEHSPRHIENLEIIKQINKVQNYIKELKVGIVQPSHIKEEDVFKPTNFQAQSKCIDLQAQYKPIKFQAQSQ